MSATADSLDRLSIRQPPGGWPIMYQTWDKLLFLHWPVSPEILRPLVPPGLELDLWQGTAWVGVTPFTMRGIRPPLTPALPWISRCHELNVRTYVHRDGIPGVWFLSLDASSTAAVWAARLTFFLPYYRAAMHLDADDPRIRFRSRRTHRGAAPAAFEAAWRLGPPLPAAEPGSQDFFLIERYCLYSARAGRIYRARIHHEPWPLRAAQLEQLDSTMIESHGLPAPDQSPLLHALAEPLRVGIWPLRRVTPRSEN